MVGVRVKGLVGIVRVRIRRRYDYESPDKDRSTRRVFDSNTKLEHSEYTIPLRQQVQWFPENKVEQSKVSPSS